MILETLFKVILSFVVSAFNLILAPLDYFIKVNLSYTFDTLIAPVNNLLNAIINFVPFIADLTFLPSFTIHLVVSYLIFKYTVLFAVFAIKMTIKWYNALKG